MRNADIEDPLFLEAVEAIDSGNISALENLLLKNPRLLSEPLLYPQAGYFKNPYLLWFVADNPIRVDKLPSNILDVTRMLIRYLKLEANNVQIQLNYTLALVATGRIPKECNVQIPLIDLLIEEGANPDASIGALANDNIEAARHLIKNGNKLTLAAAVGLDQMEDVIDLAPSCDEDELILALTVAAFYGKVAMISYLLSIGANPNGYPKKETMFHSHATPLHQAISSGSLEAVKMLVEAGASLDAKDKIYDGTPLGWAEHMTNDESTTETLREKYLAITDYLHKKLSTG